jgi:predicted RNA-binding Zn ribbon-like protein
MPLDDLVELVNEYGTRPRELDGNRAPAGPPELTVLADELHPVFATPDADTRAALVTALLLNTGVQPILTAGPDGWVVSDPAQARRASAALALRGLLAEHPGRIGVCADRQCADVYVDASPAGRRRFCCLTCQNRARAEAFRKRRAG